jgi:uncharacterized DUF497 family protein
MSMGHLVHKGVVFEWDDDKKASNPGKHSGVTFEEAWEVFFDPGLRFEDASRGEQNRDAVIGYGEKNRILYVVNVELADGGFRLISARKAEPDERRRYEEGA